MSKDLTKEDVILNKKEAIKSLNKLLEYCINDPSAKHLKKANLISYWLKDYTRFLKFEEQFVPQKNIAYKRGNIVKVNFGFNIGSEYGGLHYGIVLDNNNAHSSPVVTIIPLTSIKDDKEVHPNNVPLGNELYHSLKIKYDAASKALKAEQQTIADMLALLETMQDIRHTAADEVEYYKDASVEIYEEKIAILNDRHKQVLALERTWNEKNRLNQERQRSLENIGAEIRHMKEGSIALVNQITTISKMRIYDPRNHGGVLYGISLSEESMEKINQKVKELYIFQA